VGETEPFELIEAEGGEAIEAAPAEAMFALEAEEKESDEEAPANAAAESADPKAVPEVDICKVNYKVASTGDVFQLVTSQGTPLAYRSDNLQIARPPKGLVT